MTAICGLFLFLVAVAAGSDRDEDIAASIRNSNLPDPIKGAILITFLEDGMTEDQVARLFGGVPAKFCAGYYGIFQCMYFEYGVHFNMKFGRISGKRFSPPKVIEPSGAVPSSPSR